VQPARCRVPVLAKQLKFAGCSVGRWLQDKETAMSFVPPDFEIPELLETDRFRIRPLTIHDVVRDYDAVMTSRERLWEQFGQAWGWPSEDLTLEQDLIDLASHQKEAQRRSSFTYAVMRPDERVQLGCLYIVPSHKDGSDAAAALWVRASEAAGDLDQVLYATVRRWLAERWPFTRVAWPGRELPWDEYDALPDQ
jgi:hypothetical protein